MSEISDRSPGVLGHNNQTRETGTASDLNSEMSCFLFGISWEAWREILKTRSLYSLNNLSTSFLCLFHRKISFNKSCMAKRLVYSSGGFGAVS